MVYMCHHIKPSSVDNYLSGICQQLEPYFPSICEARKSMVCSRTLTGCKQLRGVPTKRKRALSMEDLQLIVNHYSDSHDHDDLLFIAQMLTGFFALMRLGELVCPDDNLLLDPRKLTTHTSVTMSDEDYRFFLPSHKADKFFEGNTIIIQRHHLVVDPYTHFKNYLASRDRLFPFSGFALIVLRVRQGYTEGIKIRNPTPTLIPLPLTYEGTHHTPNIWGYTRGITCFCQINYSKTYITWHLD